MRASSASPPLSSCARTGRCCWRSGRKGSRTRVTGNFPAASSSPANRRARRSHASCGKSSASSCAVPRPGSCRSSSTRTRTSSSTSSACSRGMASPRPRWAGVRMADARALRRWGRCCPRTRAFSPRSSCRRPTASRVPPTPTRMAFSRAPSVRWRGGLRLLQLRDKEWPHARRLAFARRLVPLAHRRGARVLWNGNAEGASEWGCDGVHWTRRTFAAATAARTRCWRRHPAIRARRSTVPARSVSISRCWDPLRAPRRIRMRRPLGWEAFAARIAGARLPVYALGGLTGPTSRGHRLRRSRCCAAPRRVELDASSIPIRRARHP